MTRNKRTNSRPETTTNQNGREITNSDTITVSQNDVNLSTKSTQIEKVVHEIQYDEYLGEKIPYIIHEGIKRYPVNAIGRLFGYDSKHETQLYERNKEFVAQYAVSPLLRGFSNTTSVPCLNSVGLLLLTGRANLKRLPEDRQGTVIKVVQFMAESADMRLKGELVPRQSVQQFDREKWLKRRISAAKNYNVLRDELEHHIVPTIRDPKHRVRVFQNEAKMLNKNVFGKHEKAIRDKASMVQIEALDDAEKWDAAFVHVGVRKLSDRDMLVDDMLVKHYPDLDLEQLLPEPIKQNKSVLKVITQPGQTVIFEFTSGGAS